MLEGILSHRESSAAVLMSAEERMSMQFCMLASVILEAELLLAAGLVGDRARESESQVYF